MAIKFRTSFLSFLLLIWGSEAEEPRVERLHSRQRGRREMLTYSGKCAVSSICLIIGHDTNITNVTTYVVRITSSSHSEYTERYTELSQ